MPRARRGRCGRGRLSERARRRARSASALLVGCSLAAAHARAERRLLGRRGAVGRDRRPAADRHPRRAAPGRLAAALLHAAARLDRRSPAAARRPRTRCRCCSRWPPSRSRSGAPGCVFGRRAAWIAAVLAALNPYLTQYAQETRMYSLVVLLSLLATCCSCAPTPPTSARRGGWPVRLRRRAGASRSTRTTGRCSSACRCSSPGSRCCLAPPPSGGRASSGTR